MKVKSVEKLEKSRVALTIEADAGELESAVQKVYLKQRGRIMIPGFRKGKAPRKVIEGMYGAGVFYEDAINDLYPDLFAQAAEQEKLDTVAYPEVELVGEPTRDGFTFKATVAVRPEVTLGKYKGLTAPKDVEKVTEKDIDGELRPYIARATQLVDVDRKAKKGDTVNIDYEGFIDGTPFAGGKDAGHDLELGSGMFIPGFEDQLVGVKAEGEKDVVVTFPEDYGAKELAGREATFKVKVNAVRTKQEPELDDEFAKDVSEFETLAEFREDLGKKLAERRESAARSAFEEALLDQVTEGMSAEIPDAMVELRSQRMLEDYSQRITAQGIPFEQYLSMTGMTVDMLKAQAREGALRQVKTDLALGAVAKAEGLSVSPEEIDEECKKLGEQYGMDAAQVKKLVPQEELTGDLLNRKAANVIFDSAKVGKAPAKKSAKKAEEAGPEAEKPAGKKPAAKKAAPKKAEAAAKTEKQSAEKKPAGKKTAKKAKSEE